MQTRIHYSGLNDRQVLENRQKYGNNILTPPQEQSAWQRLLYSWHFWLVRALAILTLAAAAATIVIGITGTPLPSGIWIGPVMLAILLMLSIAVAYMGGEWDKQKREFSIDPLITILLTALTFSGAVAFYQHVFGGVAGMEPFFEPIGIALAVLLATGVAHILESANEKTFKSLNEVNDNTLVKAIRNSGICEVPRRDIVVGDIVILETGEEIPADCRLLEALNLTVNESTLTGELQCTKSADPAEADPEATYPSYHIMKGCTILEGYCTAEVFAVGDATASGKVFEAAQVREGDATPLSEKLDQLAGLITKASYGIAAIIAIGRMLVWFLQGGAPDSDADGIIAFIKYALDTLMIAVTLIVVAVPEGLPMAVTLSLAFSMKRLMKQNTLPRTMHACETMGAISVICTDKTGTLTQNRMQVAQTRFSAAPELVRECICVNSTANLDFSDPDKPRALGNPTEGALLLWLHSQGIDYRPGREEAEIVSRLPFSTELKYMATLVRSKLDGALRLYVKGAPEIVMGLADVDAAERAEYEELLAGYQARGMRTLGFACADVQEGQEPIRDGRIVPGGLRMMGVTSISDPVREEVPAAIRECMDAGIQVKIVTGDTPGTAREIGRQVGLWQEGDSDSSILLGQEIEAMDDEELRLRLPAVKIISRARPNDKERVVRALRSLGVVVAVTGDGTNDAPALNAADVGLSMGDGTAVAKEASDMTIMDNSFSTIANAVMWGRSLYKNIKRFILFQMTVNVAACLTVAIGAFLGTESPLTVTQMLWVNLIMDTFAALALASLPPARSVMDEKPRPVQEHVLKGMGSRILGTGLGFTATLLAFLLLLQHQDVSSLMELRLAWGPYDGLSAYELGLFFTAFVMLQFWNLFNAKAFMTGESAFKGLSWRDTKWFILIAFIIFAGQLAIVELGGEIFSLERGGLIPMDWLLIVAVSSLVLWFGELARLIKK